ncbi:surface-adhesin E family protein [Kingella oralis]|uniref:Surface-adhesin protein E-like domain-containing protein n=1 Tax=Kingella oralis ATCC 51147 TaxID=629741 RepID=C4GMF8_9NEIS|nr:surface-adhesin E family protein [Kingella oralis]EEP66916.1 hypothetical protein GCWU000324_02892 [Kingella oralis ATCC 51147]QMT42757.1 hypothetical protein H3L93_12575 [Kingella oralis]
MLKHSFLAVAALALLAACAGDGSSKNPAMKAQGSWKEIGKINEGNIDVSYDTGSLKRQGNTATLTDRKYVHKPSKESYRNTPEYKYAISQWMFQCDARTYRTTQTEFFNDKGKSLAKHQYSASQTRYETALPDTPAASLLNIACAPKTAK